MLNAAKLKEARLRVGVSQTTIDEAIGAPSNTCYKLEHSTGTINPDQLKILCELLHVDRTYLITEGDGADIKYTVGRRRKIPSTISVPDSGEPSELQVALWRTQLQLLDLKAQVGEDVSGAYYNLVSDILRTMG